MVGPIEIIGHIKGWEKSCLFITVALTQYLWCMKKTVRLSHLKSMEVLEAIKQLILAQDLAFFIPFTHIPISKKKKKKKNLYKV